jgi:hypothetical protein
MSHDTLPTPQFELPEPKTAPGKETAERPLPTDAAPGLNKATERRNMEAPDLAAPGSPLPASQAAQALADSSTNGGASVIPGITPPTKSLIVDDNLAAEDGDLIEKAWVQKAKAIIEYTKADPYNQNREINKVKKDYIQKRYQKDVKLTDE